MPPMSQTRAELLAAKRRYYEDNKSAISLRKKAKWDAKKVVPCRECGGETVKRRGVHWCEQCQRTAPADLRVKLTPEEAERRRLERSREQSRRYRERMRHVQR